MLIKQAKADRDCARVNGITAVNSPNVQNAGFSRLCR